MLLKFVLCYQMLDLLFCYIFRAPSISLIMCYLLRLALQLTIVASIICFTTICVIIVFIAIIHINTIIITIIVMS